MEYRNPGRGSLQVSERCLETTQPGWITTAVARLNDPPKRPRAGRPVRD